MKLLILTGRKPGFSQHAPSKSSGRWGGGCKEVTSDSSVYCRARQVSPWKSADWLKRHCRCTVSYQWSLSAHFQTLTQLGLKQFALTVNRGSGLPSLLFYGQADELGQRGYCRVMLQNWRSLRWQYTHLGFEPCHDTPPPLAPPPIWCLLCTSAAGGEWLPAAWVRTHLDVCFHRGGTGGGRAHQRCHRGELPSHFACGKSVVHTPCLICSFNIPCTSCFDVIIKPWCPTRTGRELELLDFEKRRLHASTGT